MGPIMHLIIERLECKLGFGPWNNKSCNPDQANNMKMKVSDGRDYDKGNEEHKSLYAYYWFIYGALLKQGSDSEPKSRK